MDVIKLCDLNEVDEEDIVTHLNNKDVIQYSSLHIPSPYTKKMQNGGWPRALKKK